MSTSFIRFLNELEHYKSFLFLKNEKIDDSPLKNQADGQSSHILLTELSRNTFACIDFSFLLNIFRDLILNSFCLINKSNFDKI